MKRLFLAIVVAAAMVAMSEPAKADITVGGIDYSFSTTGVPVFDNTYLVVLTIDSTGATSSGNLSSFSVQFTGATLVSIDSASDGSWGAMAKGPNNPGGCNFNGAANHWCTNATDSGLDVPGGVYTFNLLVTMPEGTSLPTGTHIQAFQGQGGLAISLDDTITVIPEPATLVLMGTGLLGIAAKVRRRIRK
jgi:hypothetical protein